MAVEGGDLASMGSSMVLVIEHKSFTLVKEGSMLAITERGRRVISKLVLGSTTVQWLAKAMETCTKDEKQDFFSTVREGRRSFTTHRCSNARGRYMAVEEYGGGGRRNFIFIPEEGGSGWRRMGEMLRDFGKRGSDGLKGQGVAGHGSARESRSRHVGYMSAKEKLEVSKDSSTSAVARQSYAAAVKMGPSGVQSEGDPQITSQDQLVESLKVMETQLVELKAAIAFLSSKIDRLSAGDNRVIRNKKGPNHSNTVKGKWKIGSRSRGVWRVKKKSGLFEAGSTSGIGVKTSKECHSPHVTQDRPIIGTTPLVSETLSSELKENGVLPRSEGDVESLEVKGLAVTLESPMGTMLPLDQTNGVAGEPKDLALVPHVDECTVSVDNVAPLVSLPPIADWILPKVNEIQQFVGISHGGCEDQFNELITAIEASHTLETKSFKKSRELQRLFSTINYDAKGDSSTRGKSKGRTL